MTQTYEHKGVKITPLPGGYYELNHSSLKEPERERGKEKAEQRADEIAAAAASVDPDAHITQGDLPDDVPQLEPEQQSGADMTAVMEQLKKMQAHIDELSAAGVRTVGQTEGEAREPLVAPNKYAGEMSKDDRKKLEKQGHKVIKIILEENETIPPTGLFIGHNGRSYMIQPGVPVDVPDFLVGVLDNAVTSAPIVNSETKKVIGYRDRLKYAYRRVE